MNATQEKLVAEEFLSAFECKYYPADRKRGLSQSYYRLRDGSPRWMVAAIEDAHDSDLLPGNWADDQCHSILCELAITEPERWEDSVGAWADSGVEDYELELREDCLTGGWLARFVNECFGFWDTFYRSVEDLVEVAQCALIEEIASILIDAVREQAKEREAAENDGSGPT